MKPSALIRVSMASLLTLGVIACCIYYNKINTKEEIVLMDELYNPVIYEGDLVSNELTDEVIIEPKKVINKYFFVKF